jgi:hypothetical protein
MRFLLFLGFRTLANWMFGFYPKVGRARAAKVPAECVRKQTVKNAKRYTTPERDDRQRQLLGAEEESLRRGGRMWGRQVTVWLTVPLSARLRRPPRIVVNPSGGR